MFLGDVGSTQKTPSRFEYSVSDNKNSIIIESYRVSWKYRAINHKWVTFGMPIVYTPSFLDVLGLQHLAPKLQDAGAGMMAKHIFLNN